MADKQKQLLAEGIGRGQDKHEECHQDRTCKTDERRIRRTAAKQRENNQRQSDKKMPNAA